MTNKSVYVEGYDILVEEMFSKRGWIIEKRTPLEADLVCFTGGSDVSPMLYETVKHLRTVNDPVRDQRCCDIFWSLSQDKPTVGICRGGQLLNVLCGGELHQDVNNHTNNPHTAISPETGQIFDVTSDHHQMMIPGVDGEVLLYAEESTEKLPEGGYSNDIPPFDVEAVFYEEQKALCFQPHPEWVEKDHECQKLFFDLIEEYL